MQFHNRQLPSVFRLFALLTALVILSGVPVSADERHEKQAIETNATVPEDSGDAPAQEAKENNSDSTDESADKPLIDPNSGLYRAVKYAGKFHVMVIHFPIAFFLGAAVVQWFLVFRGKGQTVVAVMLWFGTLGAVAAAALGWMYAYDSVYFGESENILFWHRWLGTGTATLAVIVLLLRNKLGTKGLAVALTACAGLVGIAAHYGASLVYGPDFLLKF
ncbi:MAG: hypothetical protein ABJ118_06095 [Luteolibacter sp.]